MDGRVRHETISPQDVGLPAAPIEKLVASDLDHAAAMVRAVIEGTDTGPARNMALLNAAATLLVAGAVDSLKDGLARAADAISSGAA